MGTQVFTGEIKKLREEIKQLLPRGKNKEIKLSWRWLTDMLYKFKYSESELALIKKQITLTLEGERNA